MAERSQIEEIKEALNIVDVVREYVPLKRSGSNEFGICPFHHEKTPSFSVNADLGIFKCFGCGESGDVIAFLQKIEGLDFPEALKLAASKAGIKLKENFSPKDKALAVKKAQIYEINELTAKFFNFVLQKHKAGIKARSYLSKRKISQASIKKFKLGYAPRRWTALKAFLNDRDYSDSLLIEAGLLVSKNGKIYDKFRGRIVFPLFDEQGRVTGFAGRIIDSDSKAPKYLNSPETPIFNKSRFLFGLYQGKNEIRSSDFCILVEGPTDVISSNQAGVTNICAPQGTSLTLLQLKLLSRYCSTVYVCFDQDRAGQIALRRAAELAQKENFDIRVIDLVGVKDADELIRKRSKEWKERIKNAQKVIDYFFGKIVEKYNVGTVDGKVKIAEEILPLISNLNNEVERTHYLNELALNLDIDPKTLLRQLKKLDTDARIERSVLRKGIKEGSSLGANHGREAYLLAILLQCKDISLKMIRDIPPNIFQSDSHREILEMIKKSKRGRLKSLVSVLKKKSDEKLVAETSDLMLMQLGDMVEDIDWVENEVKIVAKLLQKTYFRRELKKFQLELSMAEKRGDEKKVDALNKKILGFTQRLHAIK